MIPLDPRIGVVSLNLERAFPLHVLYLLDIVHVPEPYAALGPYGLQRGQQDANYAAEEKYY